MQQRWPTTDDQRRQVVERLIEIVLDPDSTVSEVTAAGRIIATFESQNQTDEHKELDEFSNRVLELAKRFGIVPSATKIGDSARGRARAGNGGPALQADEKGEGA